MASNTCKTNRLLWAFATAVLFVVVGLWPLGLSPKSEDCTLLSPLMLLLRGNFASETGFVVRAAIVNSLFTLAIAIALGWPLHALFVAAWTRRARAPIANDPTE